MVLIFTNTNENRVIKASVWKIAIDNIDNIAPTNPETKAQYFVVNAGGWDSDWAASLLSNRAVNGWNVLREPVEA